VQAVIAALKLAAINFGETAGALDCHVIHVKGNSHIFSCYDIGSSGNVRLCPRARRSSPSRPHTYRVGQAVPEPCPSVLPRRRPQLLAFYSEMHATSIELFDTEVADAELQPILTVLDGLLKQLPAP